MELVGLARQYPVTISSSHSKKCEHGRIKYQCKDCGTGLCEHGKCNCANMGSGKGSAKIVELDYANMGSGKGIV